ncbi:ubiquitinyl hydrolase 1 [Malassezia cuniculi]|uniref:Ubiquitinyl hydrolase 1 n=1 Tax=Malassezia cuniculi TaxID=948313 RepID=A0AAF0EYX0_9BASI|nr:ubiquitinyl hydrolase 1 [Malassezia cuniculi]
MHAHKPPSKRSVSREAEFPSALSFTSSPLEPFAPSHARLSFSGDLPDNSLVRRRSSSVRALSEHHLLHGVSGAERPHKETLRRLYLPRSAIARFLTLAGPQSAQDRETCAFLLGREQHGALYVTDLVAPPQSGESDSCTADGEELLVSYQEEHGLMTLGWIHTHPSQSCFLSSLDLHTQAAYQALLPEAIAVVCALQHSPSLGIFRLTQPDGLACVLQCNNPAPFHPHPCCGNTPLYTDALRGHVSMTDGPLVVRDLR